MEIDQEFKSFIRENFRSVVASNLAMASAILMNKGYSDEDCIKIPTKLWMNFFGGLTKAEEEAIKIFDEDKA